MAHKINLLKRQLFPALAYRYSDGCDAHYGWKELSDKERTMILRLLQLWGFTNDRPTEVAIVLKD